MAEKKWYVVHTKTGCEEKVKTGIQERIKAEGMEKNFFQVLVPMESVAEVKGGKRTISQRKFFPGYLFVEMELNDESWYLVKNTPGVTGFVGAKNSPAVLSENEAKSLLKKTEEKKEKPTPKIAFSVGEPVKVVNGPFTNFDGTVEEINPDKGKLRVMVSIFGRSTPVELEYWQVEKL